MGFDLTPVLLLLGGLVGASLVLAALLIGKRLNDHDIQQVRALADSVLTQCRTVHP